MNDEQLQHLLSRADASMPPHGISIDLAERVSERWHRRRARRYALVVVSLVILGMTLTLERWELSNARSGGLAIARPVPLSPPALSQMPVSPLPAPATSVVHGPETDAPLAIRIGRLQQDAQLEQAVADALLRAEAHRSSRAVELHDQPIERLHIQREQTASILERHADRLSHMAGEKADAILAYQRVLTLFPQSAAAELARRRLREL